MAALSNLNAIRLADTNGVSTRCHFEACCDACPFARLFFAAEV